MNINPQVVLDQIDSVLEKYASARSRSKYDDCSDLGSEPINELITLMAATIDRLSAPGSRYRANVLAAFTRYPADHPINLAILAGILKALRVDYAAGNLRAFHELIHADVFSDFLEMADYLLRDGYKDASAVLAGGVLEEHLRKLCEKFGIGTIKDNRPVKADGMNAVLANAGAYSKLDQKSVTAWLDLRNDSAHGNYHQYTKEQVALMLQGIRDFVSRHAA